MITARERALVPPALVVAWAIGGVALSYLDRQLRDRLGITAHNLWIAYWFGAVAAVWVLVYLVRRQRLPRHTMWSVAGFAALVPLIASVHQPLAVAGDNAEFRRRFERLAPSYAAIIQQLENRSIPVRGGAAAEIRFLVDSGPPLRVAFPETDGILDNWEGVIYDPSGAVLSAGEFGSTVGAPAFSAAPEVRRLFGGDLVACERVRDAYYRCWFT
jgi:hypothetical protein